MFFSFAIAKVSNLEKPGKSDYLLKIHAPSMKYYQEFVLNVLGNLPHLGSLESFFVMDTLKHNYGISL